jgi:hypothetical protein
MHISYTKFIKYFLYRVNNAKCIKFFIKFLYMSFSTLICIVCINFVCNEESTLFVSKCAY